MQELLYRPLVFHGSIFYLICHFVLVVELTVVFSFKYQGPANIYIFII